MSQLRLDVYNAKSPATSRCRNWRCNSIAARPEAFRLKGAPIEFKTLAEKYLLKIARSLGVHRDEFPTGSSQAQKLLREFLSGSTSFHILKQNGDILHAVTICTFLKV